MRSEKSFQRSRKTLSTGPTAWFVCIGSTCPPKHSEPTFRIESEKFNSSPNLVSGDTSQEKSTLRTSAHEKSTRTIFARASCGGMVQIFCTNQQQNGLRGQSFQSQRFQR